MHVFSGVQTFLRILQIALNARFYRHQLNGRIAQHLIERQPSDVRKRTAPIRFCGLGPADPHKLEFRKPAQGSNLTDGMAVRSTNYGGANLRVRERTLCKAAGHRERKRAPVHE